ncbi:hypothetical protein ACTQWG_02015 [Blautia sp. HCP3S3_H10_1]
MLTKHSKNIYCNTFKPDLIGNLGTLDYKIAGSQEIIASYER